MSYTYPGRTDPTLKGLNLEIEKGTFTLLTGPTGCGKSTLLKAMNGLIPHVAGGTLEGRVVVDGIDTCSVSMARLCQKVGLVFQSPDDQIFSTMVLDEVAFGPENLALPRPLIQSRVRKALKTVGLNALAERGTDQLSGGQKQRLAIGSILAMNPDVLLLDEPFAQLDPKGTREVLAVIAELNRRGMTVVLVEHRIHEVVDRADRVVVMDHGRIVADSDPRHVFQRRELIAALGLRIPESVAFSWAMKFGKIALNLEEVKTRLQETAGAESNVALRPLDSLGESGERPMEVGARSSRGTGRAEAEPRAPVLKTERLFFRYDRKGDFILKDLSLSVLPGEMVSLMGNNGCGKSTLLLHFAGLLKPERGNVFVRGRNVWNLKPWRLAGQVGIVFQNPTLMLFNETVREEVEFGPKALNRPGSEWGPYVAELSRVMGLGGLERDNPLALSGGQRLRVALASVLSMQPDVVLFDEPTSGQDRSNSDGLLQYLRGLSQRGTTVLFSTHDVDAALRYSTRLVVMTDGRIIADASPQEVVRREEIMEQACLRVPLCFEIGKLLNFEAFCTDDLIGKAVCSA